MLHLFGPKTGRVVILPDFDYLEAILPLVQLKLVNYLLLKVIVEGPFD